HASRCRGARRAAADPTGGCCMTRSLHVQFKALAPSHAGPLVLAFTLMFTEAGAGTASGTVPLRDEIAAASAASQASAPLMTDPEIVGALHAHMESLHAGEEFSGVVLLAKGTTPLFREAYGLASRAAGTPNRPDTKF